MNSDLVKRAEEIMERERHRPFPYSTDGLETASLIWELVEALKRKDEDQ